MDRTAALAKFTETIGNPGAAVGRWKELSGGKAVGCLSCMPPFAPEELIHAAGMLPVGIWGAEVPVSLADARMQSFSCSVARTSLEMLLKGSLEVCDGFMFSLACDAFQNLSEIWKLSTGRPCLQLACPKKVDRGAAMAYLEQEFARIRGQVEALSGKPIGDDDLRNSVNIFNEHRRLLRDLDQARRNDPSFLSAGQMMEIVYSSGFLAREEHSMLLGAVLASSPDFSGKDLAAGKAGKGQVRVFLTGIMPRPAVITSVLEEVGVSVVGDDLGMGGLYYSLEIPDTGDPWRDMVAGYLSYPPCSTLHRGDESRGEVLVRQARDTGAEGVLILATKFCEPEFFDYPYLKEDLEKAGVPVLLLETEIGMGAPESIRIRVEAFVETLREKKNG